MLQVFERKRAELGSRFDFFVATLEPAFDQGGEELLGLFIADCGHRDPAHGAAWNAAPFAQHDPLAEEILHQGQAVVARASGEVMGFVHDIKKGSASPLPSTLFCLVP